MVSPYEEGDVKELAAFLFLSMDFFLKEEVEQSDRQSVIVAACLREKEGSSEASRGIRGIHWVRA